MKVINKIVNHYWEGGYNCSSCTAGGLLSIFKDPNKNILLESLSGFDNLDLENTICGGVLGIYLAMSKILTNRDLSEKEIKLRLSLFRHEFTQLYSSINCHTIMSKFNDNQPDSCSSNTVSNCKELMINSVYLAKKILNWKKEEPIYPH